MKTSVILREVVAAAKLGQKTVARNLLREIHEREPKNEQALMWSAALAESPEEAMRHLEHVLEINPQNTQALNVLAVHRLNRPRRDAGAAHAQPVAQSQQHYSSGATATQPIMETPSQANWHTPAQSVPELGDAADMGPRLVRLSDSVKRTKWQCPLCRAEADSALARCGACGAVQLLDDLQAIAENKNINEGLIEEAVHRLRREIAAEESFDGHLSISKALLNLNRSTEALSNLKKALELRPNDSSLRQLVKVIENRNLILAVDDSVTVRKVVALTLERKGYRVLTANDGMEALAMLNEHRPDLILLDITMPRMDGYQVCKVIKQNPYTKGIPVLMLSGNDGFFDKMKGKLAGATDYLTKPFKEEALLKSLGKYIKPKKEEDGSR